MLISLPSEGEGRRGAGPLLPVEVEGSPTLSVKGSMRRGNQNPPLLVYEWKLKSQGELRAWVLPLNDLGVGEKDWNRRGLERGLVIYCFVPQYGDGVGRGEGRAFQGRGSQGWAGVGWGGGALGLCL